MAKPKMGWDPRQSRWRKTYKGVPLQILATDLGGTNRDDTLIAANRWFEEQKEKIDAQNLQKRLQPQEAAYEAENEEMKTAIAFLSKFKGTDLESLVETMQEKVSQNRQVPQNIDTPPLGLPQRNPLHISDREIRDAADSTAFEEAVRDRLETYERFKHQKGWLDHQGYYTLDSFGGKIPDGAVLLSCQDYFEGNFENDKWKDRCGGFHFGSLKNCFQYSFDLARSYDFFESYAEADALQKELASQPVGEEEIQKLAERVVDFMNHVEIRYNIWTDFSMREQRLRETYEDAGAIGDFKRSEILCRMNERGLAVPKTKQISYHANAFFCSVGLTIKPATVSWSARRMIFRSCHRSFAGPRGSTAFSSSTFPTGLHGTKSGRSTSTSTVSKSPSVRTMMTGPAQKSKRAVAWLGCLTFRSGMLLKTSFPLRIRL